MKVEFISELSNASLVIILCDHLCVILMKMKVVPLEVKVISGFFGGLLHSISCYHLSVMLIKLK